MWWYRINIEPILVSSIQFLTCHLIGWQLPANQSEAMFETEWILPELIQFFMWCCHILHNLLSNPGEMTTFTMFRHEYQSVLYKLICASGYKQGKSEGFDSCDQPSNHKLDSNHQFSARVTVKFDGWPRKTIGHFFYTTSSFVHHFKSIGEFKLDLQSRNAQFGSKLVICYPVWPWKLMNDLGKQ